MCPPNSQQSASSQAGDLQSEEVRTIFVLGFLPDVTQSDFSELLQYYPGFEACMMDFKGDQPLGFARFRTQMHALAARDALQNMTFSRGSGQGTSVLRAELARKNLYVKSQHGRFNQHRGSQEASTVSGTGSSDLGAPAFSAGLATGPSPMSWNIGAVGHMLPPQPPLPSPTPVMPPTGMPNGSVPIATLPVYNLPGQMSAPQMSALSGMGVMGSPGAATCFIPYFTTTSTFTQIVPGAHGALMTPMFPPGTAYGYPLTRPASFPNVSDPMTETAKLQALPAPQTPLPPHRQFQNTKDHPPCNTLFIGNLGVGTHEWEIRAFFGSLPGFRQLKVLRSDHGTTCFVEFQDIASAAAIHSTMQGVVLKTSDRGGMRIQFSKNPFGTRGDSGPRVGVPGAATLVEGKKYGLRSGLSTGSEAMSRRDVAWRSLVPREPRTSGRGRQEEAAPGERGMSTLEKERAILAQGGGSQDVEKLAEALEKLGTEGEDSGPGKTSEAAL